jgi:annexin A7/11
MCSRTKEHLKIVDKKYHDLYGKSLIQQIKSETSGYYEDLLVALVAPYDDFDSTIIKKACDGKPKSSYCMSLLTQ